MIKTAIKTFVLFITTILVLSINIKDRPLFSYIYDVISPATESVQDSVASFFSDSFSNTHKVSKQLFDNSVPKVKDKISSKLSAPAGKPQEKIEREEKQQLDDLIKDHSKR
jgi:hypothetical protein